MKANKEKLRRAGKKIVPQEVTPIGKGDRLWQAVEFLEEVDPTTQAVTRQRLKGEFVGNVIKTKDVMPLLNLEKLKSFWGIIPMDKLVEWAWQEGCQNLEELKENFELIPIGGSECTIEIACDPERQDLINIFESKGIAGLRKLLEEREEKIATDTPGIAEYFFGSKLLLKLSGSIEALPTYLIPVIIGVVESGGSLKKEGWLRLSEDYQEATLLRSQLMLVIKKENYRKEKDAN